MSPVDDPMVDPPEFLAFKRRARLIHEALRQPRDPSVPRVRDVELVVSVGLPSARAALAAAAGVTS